MPNNQRGKKTKHVSKAAFTHTHCRCHTETPFTQKPFCTHTILHRDTLTHKPFYTHTHAFTHRHFYTQKLLHTNPFTQMHFYTQTLLHTNKFTQKRSYTQTLLHTNTFTHRSFYTHTDTHTHTVLHTNTFTHRPSNTQTLLHTNPFTHKPFDTETLWHTEAATRGPHLHTDPLTHKRLHSYTNTLLHPTPVTSQFFLSFWPSTIISCEGVAPGQVRHKKKRNFSSVFDHRPSFRAKGLLRDKSGTTKIAILPQFLAIDPHFVRKCCSGTSPAQEKSQFYLFLAIDRHFVRKCCSGTSPAQEKSQFYLSFWRSTLISRERVADK